MLCEIVTTNEKQSIYVEGVFKKIDYNEDCIIQPMSYIEERTRGKAFVFCMDEREFNDVKKSYFENMTDPNEPWNEYAIRLREDAIVPDWDVLNTTDYDKLTEALYKNGYYAFFDPRPVDNYSVLNLTTKDDKSIKTIYYKLSDEEYYNVFSGNTEQAMYILKEMYTKLISLINSKVSFRNWELVLNKPKRNSSLLDATSVDDFVMNAPKELVNVMIDTHYTNLGMPENKDKYDISGRTIIVVKLVKAIKPTIIYVNATFELDQWLAYTKEDRLEILKTLYKQLKEKENEYYEK